MPYYVSHRNAEKPLGFTSAAFLHSGLSMEKNQGKEPGKDVIAPMYCFTNHIQPAGPFLDLHIGVSAEQQACFEAKGRSIPPPLFVQGLVDTGATMTCIDLSLPQRLTLNPRGPMSMFTPSTGAHGATSETYDVRLTILPTDRIRFPDPYHRSTLHVVAQPLADQRFHAIIGRDILDAGILDYDGTRKRFTLKFF